ESHIDPSIRIIKILTTPVTDKFICIDSFFFFKQKTAYDIVHAHLSSGTDLLILPFLSELAQKGKAAVMTVHGHWPYDRNTYMDSYFKKYYAKDIATISISRAMQRLLPKGFRDVGFVHNSLEPETLSFRTRPGIYRDSR